MKVMKSYVVMTPLIFAAAWAFYYLTGAAVPYPGVSSDYLAGILFPGQWPLVEKFPLDDVLWRMLAIWVPHEHFMAVARGVCATIGALAIASVLRSAISGVRLSTSEVLTFHRREQALAFADIHAVSYLVGVGASLMALMMLPLWALATRPIPGALSMVLTIMLFGMSLSVRWRSMLAFYQHEPQTFQARMRMATVFFLATYLCTTAIILTPVIFLCLLEACRIFFKRDATGRLTYLPWLLLGILLGLLCSVITVNAWNAYFVIDQAHLPGAVQQWIDWLVTTGKVPMVFFRTFPGLSALTLVLCAAFLHMGCFPGAYRHFGFPLVGQISILALMVCALVMWPPELWETMSEPTPLMTLGWILLTLSFGLLVGSWIKVWLDAHAEMRRYLAYPLAGLVLLVISGAFAWGQYARHGLEGAANPATKASVTQGWITEELRPTKETLWLKADPMLAEFFVTCWINGVPVVPIQETATALPLLPNLADTIAQDPTLALVYETGNAHLEAYLHQRPDLVTMESGTFPVAARADLERTRLRLEQSPFANTPLGKRVVQNLRFEITKLDAAIACTQTPDEAVVTLRNARALAPENDGILLSLEALKVLYGEEARQALLIRENSAWMRAPTWEQLADFEDEFGPVRAPMFYSGWRFAQFLNVFQAAAYPALTEAYLRAPADFADFEREVALLALPQEEALIAVQRDDVTVDELTLVLCLYPTDPRCTEIFEKHRAKLTSRNGLMLLYNKHSYLSDQQITERVRSFFSRDGHFPYALYALQAYLRQGRMEDALDFVQNLVVENQLRTKPWLMENLRLHVIRQLAAQDPARAEELLRKWLEFSPLQPFLWSELLALPSATWEDVIACLEHYPLHLSAIQKVQQRLAETVSEAAAQDYRARMDAARAKLKEDPRSYAHLGL